MFDDTKPAWATERAQLGELLDETAYAQARRTTINAHYTDPATVRAVWSALTRLGFTGGDVLEPGSGAGTFIGMAPDTATMTGVELDATTAGISRHLYPAADVRAESFADTRFPTGHFDAVVGNVPFANVTLHDPVHNAGGHSIHNHFIIKSLALTRPGGMVAVLSSHFTLDAANPAARREMNQMADLVGAVRLPSGAFRRSAGTEAVTDLLLFRRRLPGEAKADTTWETVIPRIVDGEQVKINGYFEMHPEHIIGDLHVGTGMYGATTLHVTADLTTAHARVDAAVIDVVDRALERGATFTTPSGTAVVERAARAAAATDLWDGTITAADDGTFTVATGGILHPLTVPKTHTAELRALLTLRDRAKALLEAESATVDDTADVLTARTALRTGYEAYLQRFGPLNRYTLRPTGKADPVTGDPRMARITPRPIATLRQDPFGPLVMALEQFDDATQTASPASIMTERTVAPRPVAYGADTPADAIALSLDRSGTVDLPYVAHLLGQSETDARGALGDLVFDDPETGRLVPAPEYLSGNVREKLAAAQTAALDDDRFVGNVDALRTVLPSSIGVDEIEARMGAVWISADEHRQFLQELLADQTVRVENPMPGEWEVRGARWGVRARNEWGTERRPATDIAQALMEQKQILVLDEIDGPDGQKVRVVNPVETEAAQEKAAAMQDRFREWVWEDPARAARLGEEYNRRFNAIVLRDYSAAGDYLTLPGLAANFSPRPHQRAAVARMIAEPAVGLFHEVGAGKTAEMVMGCMEMRRMGLVRKPVVVVPNHMLEQFSREWLQMYPQARILAASSDDLTADKRRLFVARAAANDWDAIIMTQTAFQKVPVSKDFESAYIGRQAAELRIALDAAVGEDAMSIKRIERRVLALEEKHKRLLDKPSDPGLTFERTGIDYVVVDEAHMYKNLATDSNIADARIDGSQKASDLHMKLEYLRSEHGDRVGTMATATPLSNSITEAYVMQRYLRPDQLQHAGITAFDSWAATFGETVSALEMGPSGGFRMKTRFAKFQNVPEMLRMWHVFADVKTAEDLHLPVPLIAARASDGARQPETVTIPPTPEVRRYVKDIVRRAELIERRMVPPEEDNMLMVSTDGRKAALDIRLVDPTEIPTGGVKLDAVADRVVAEWQATKDTTYLDVTTREPSPVPGGLQLVFSDLGTPNPDRWNAYDDLKQKLVDRGMPAESIRFIHEARNDTDKARIFAAARAGHIAVLIGSTQKMGVGTNVQARLTALHHVDCPWRPADIEQRDGRGIRQGNQNPEVAITRYVVEGTFDAYSWQTVARKAQFINQVMRGRLDSREIDDIGDTALTANEAKALASGNPLLLEKADADMALQKLRRRETAHHRAQAALRHTLDAGTNRIQTLERDQTLLEAAAERTDDITGDRFRITIGDRVYDSRPDAAEAIAHWAQQNGVRYLSPVTSRPLTLGSVGGHEISVHAAYSLDAARRVELVLALRDVPRTAAHVSQDDLRRGGIGVIRQLENKTQSIPRTLHAVTAELDDERQEHAAIGHRIGQPFPHIVALHTAQARVDDVDSRLHARAEKSASPSRRTAPQTAVPRAPASAYEPTYGGARHSSAMDGPTL